MTSYLPRRFDAVAQGDPLCRPISRVARALGPHARVAGVSGRALHVWSLG